MANAKSEPEPAEALDILASTARYEGWLTRELDGELVRKDLDRKHARMVEGPFPFLRATYWRWAERILNLCPDLAEAESVLAVGDIHLENFGTWRDADGRLVWGVNDYDEAAAMPWPLDLLRLATSALLAEPTDGPDATAIAKALLDGYIAGLQAPAPCVLDQQPGELRDAVAAATDGRGERYWARLEERLRQGNGKPPARWLAALADAMPPGATIIRLAHRTAGTGSLGRPRWVALAEWRGGMIAREAKAVVTSGWVLPEGRGPRALRCQEAATGHYRVPDPWYAVIGNIAVRRLSPHNIKIEVRSSAATLLRPAMLAAMGRELASIHRASASAAMLHKELAALPRSWLKRGAERAAELIRDEQAQFRAAQAESEPA